MSVHIVVHCYAVELPAYSRMLQFQLSSLALHPPKVPVTIEVCYTDMDRRTTDVLEWFIRYTSVRVEITPPLPADRLFRRAIGRNAAALRSHSDLVWFTDVDHCFGEGCLDGLWAAWQAQTEFSSMYFPQQVMVHSTHKMGDDCVAISDMVGLVNIAGEFRPMRYRKAIGGVQIVSGSFARKYGYLDHHRRYQQPLGRPFANFHDDVAYRKFCLQHGPITPIDIPNLYRIRHSCLTYKNQPQKIS